MQKKHFYGVLMATVLTACTGTAISADTSSITIQDQANDEMALGRQAIQNKNWTQAIASFKKAGAENPKNNLYKEIKTVLLIMSQK